MKKWTTPSVKCTIPNELPLDYVLLTLKQDAIKIEKKVMASEVEDGVFYVTFTQEETSLFDVGKKIKVQVNIMSGNTRLASRILEIVATCNLHDEALYD